MSRFPNHLRSKAASAKVVGIVFAIIGTIFSAVGFGFAWSSWSLLSVAERTEGTVIRMVARQRGAHNRNRGGAAPVVEFHVAGERHEYHSKLSTSPPQFSVGEKVTILYDPKNPRDAGIDSFVTLWLFPTVFGGIGAVMLTVAAVIGITSWMRNSSATHSPSSNNSDSGNYLDERIDQ